MWFAPSIVIGPAQEPISVAEAKEYLRLDADDASFDTEVSAYIGSARQQVEQVTGTRLISQVVMVRCNQFEGLNVLPIAPVQSILSLSYVDQSRVVQTLATENYELIGSEYSWGIFTTGNPWPVSHLTPGAIRAELKVGYGDNGFDVPDDIRVAMLRAVRAMFDDRPFDLETQLINRRIWLAA